MEENYNKRELDLRFNDIRDNFGLINKKLDNIDKKVSDTNGKVADVLIWKAKRNERERIIYILVGVLVLPVITWIITNIININQNIATEVKKGVESELSKYEIEIKK